MDAMIIAALLLSLICISTGLVYALSKRKHRGKVVAILMASSLGLSGIPLLFEDFTPTERTANWFGVNIAGDASNTCNVFAGGNKYTRIRAGNYTFNGGSDKYAVVLNAKIWSTNGTTKTSGVIYDSNGDLMSITEEKLAAGNESVYWLKLPFITPFLLVDGTEYRFGIEADHLVVNAGETYTVALRSDAASGGSGWYQTVLNGYPTYSDPASLTEIVNHRYILYVNYKMLPINSVPVPSDGAVDISLNPDLNITVDDEFGYSMNQTFRTNASGSWEDIAWNNDSYNATFSNSTSVFTSYSTKYYWSSNTTDEYGLWDNDTYSFTTETITDAGWSNYRVVTVESDYIETTLTNFPILVAIDNSTWNIDNSKSIRFLGADNSTVFLHEIEKWDDSGNCYLWVNISEGLPSGSDYSFFCYYNNVDATTGHNPEGVWDSHYLGVYHLNGSNDAGIDDSTSNDNDATGDAGNPSYQQTGKIGYAVTFDGSDDSIVLPQIFASEDTYSLEAWVYTQTGARYFISQWTATGGQQGTFIQYGAPSFQWYVNGAKDTLAATLNEWSRVTMSYDGGPDIVEFNVNATLYKKSTSIAAPSFPSEAMYFSDRSAGGREFVGVEDEIRFSDIARNQSWMNASYHSENQTDTFMTFGAEQPEAEDDEVFANTTIRNNGIDYFTWLGQNVSAWHVAKNITGFDEGAEYLAILNASGNWWNYSHHGGDGGNWSINTFDAVKSYLTDAVGNQTFNMTNNTEMGYNKARTITLVDVDAGNNYTSWANATKTDLSAANTSIGLASGYFIALWNTTDFKWNFWISHFAGNTNVNIHRWDVCLTHISTDRTWAI